MEVLNNQSASEPAAAHSFTRLTDIWSFGRAPWIWWHILSFDAPTVAVLWCWFFATVFGIRFSWIVLSTLALGTWCVYIADRLLDGILSRNPSILRDRHWFYVRHRGFFVRAWIAAAIPLGYLILFRIQPSVRRDDILLGLIGLSYFGLIHGLCRGRGCRFPKELAVGYLFAIATAVPVWTRTTIPLERASLAIGIVAFGTACWLNCAAIQIWEDAEAQELMQDALTLDSDVCFAANVEGYGLARLPGEHLMAFAVALAAASIFLAALTASTTAWPLFACVALSAFFFAILIRYSGRFSALTLRIAADAALLTPLVFLLHGLQ